MLSSSSFASSSLRAAIRTSKTHALSSSTAARTVSALPSRNFYSSARRTAAIHHGHTFATGSYSRIAQPARNLRRISQARTMFIQTETTPNEDSLKFIPGVEVMGDGTAEFMDTRSALKSPLAIRLMGIEGVTGVFYGPDFVTVSKDPETSWSVIKPEVYAMLMEHFSSGQPLFRSDEDREAAGPQDTRILDTDSETVAMIKELLETRVRPAIMEDGGDIEYRGFTDDGIVQVKLKGSCRGCSSSTVTLKSGIERMLMHYIPEVKGVEQILDQEEAIALNEFEKLESRLAKEHGHEKDSSISQYMSV
ncbi:HIRA-interacting protein 5 [Cerioporus squamosus]|nr:HIRA-interacting protein 5 [Cerioporus squamosus]